MKIGYARVSTTEQNLDMQVDALRITGCEQIYTDKMSGSTMTRDGLDAALAQLSEGDMLVVWKLDRLGRSVKGLVDTVDMLRDRGVQFRSLTDSIDTTTPMGRFFFHVMAALAEMERELIRERTKAGLEAAHRKGVRFGRRRSLGKREIEAGVSLLSQGWTNKDVAQTLGVSESTWYRAKKR